jgi:FkbM family methyltransferase
MFYDDNLLTTNKKIVFWGAGNFGRQFLNEHCPVRVRLPDYIVDSDKSRHGTYFFQIPVCTPDRLAYENPDDIAIVLTTTPFYLAEARDRFFYYDFHVGHCLDMRFCLETRGPKEIAEVRAGFADDKSRTVFDALTARQAAGDVWFRDVYEPDPYWGNDVIPELPPGGALIDGGAFRGDNVFSFVHRDPGFRAVWAFEPHAPFRDTLEQRFASEPRVHIRGDALYRSCGAMSFLDTHPLGAHLTPNRKSGPFVNTVRADDVADAPVTFIKMDIEGGELEALRGCEQTIRRDRPQLAICVYHRPSDYFDIPRLIRSIRPDYRLYLRHHSPYNTETVLYAV